jgi:hypothetical protein
MVTVMAFVFGFYLGVLLMSLLVLTGKRGATEPGVSLKGSKELSVKEDLQADPQRMIVPTNSHY